MGQHWDVIRNTLNSAAPSIVRSSDYLMISPIVLSPVLLAYAQYSIEDFLNDF